jgi:energy-coupling factor transporter transmembrane protein EcfT
LRSFVLSLTGLIPLMVRVVLRISRLAAAAEAACFRPRVPVILMDLVRFATCVTQFVC